MAKKVIIILVVLFLTGCQVNYKLDFNNNEIKENIEINLLKDAEEIEIIKNAKPYAINTYKYKTLYNIKHKNGLKNFTANFDYTYSPTSFKLASSFLNCFDAFGFVKNENDYILSTSQGFKCMNVEYKDVDNYHIEITTNRVVKDNNADSIENGKYIWNIDKDNAKDTKILMIFGEVKEKTFMEKIIDFIKKHMATFIAIIVLFLVILIPTLVIIKKSKENNDI